MDAPKPERSGPVDSKVPKIIGIVAAAFLASIVISNFMPSTKPSDQGTSQATRSTRDTPAQSRPKDVRAGKWAKVTTAFFGCRESDDISRIKQLARQRDSEAAARVAEEKDCKSFDAGATGYVEHISGWSGISCLRERAQPNCYWYPTPFLEASSEPD